MQARRPAKSKQIKDTTQTIELVFFLRMILLELTDLAIQQGSRRSQKLFRDAAQKAQTGRGRSESATRLQALKAREVLRDETKTWRARCLEADQLLSELLDAPQGSFLSHVRRALAADQQRGKAFLGGLEGLELGGQADDAGFAQWTAWRDLQGMKATELPPDFRVPEVGAAWHDLVHQRQHHRDGSELAETVSSSRRAGPRQPATASTAAQLRRQPTPITRAPLGRHVECGAGSDNDSAPRRG